MKKTTLQQLSDNMFDAIADYKRKNPTKKKARAKKPQAAEPRAERQESVQSVPAATYSTQKSQPAWEKTESVQTVTRSSTSTSTTSTAFGSQPARTVQTSVKPSTSTPVASTANGGSYVVPKDSSKPEKKSKKKLIITIVALSVLLCATLVFAFTLHEWWQWQHVIGSFGGAASLVVVALAVIFVGALIREQSDDYEKECIVALALLLVANTVLTFVLAGKYYVISYWINGWMAVAGLFMCAGCLATDKKGLAIPFAVETLGAVAVIVLRALLSL